MAAIEPIKIEGLRDFQKALKNMDSDLPKALRVALNNAVTIIVTDAKPKIPKNTGKAAASLKTVSTQTKARVKAGGSKAPYFPWLDFGGKRRGRGGGVAIRPFYKQGRFVWLSLAEKREEVLAGLQDALIEVARTAGLEVTSG